MMRDKNNRLTRRDFIKGAGCVAVGVVAGLPVLAEETGQPLEKSKVVLIRHKDVVSAEGELDGDLVRQMLDEAMVILFEKDKPNDCWKEILRPNDIVGIKSNVWRHLPTPSEVEQAIRRRILDVGIPEKSIVMGDRDVLEQETFHRTTALINTRPMRTHAWSGVGSLIKNYIMFSPNPPDYHDDACAGLARLWNLPIVKGKTRLNVLVMLTPQFHTIGPHHFDRSYVWSYNGLIVSTDPVAADSIGLQIIQQKRRRVFGEERPLQPTAHHIALADKEFHLGNSEMDKIELIKLGWDKDILI